MYDIKICRAIIIHICILRINIGTFHTISYQLYNAYMHIAHTDYEIHVY